MQTTHCSGINHGDGLPFQGFSAKKSPFTRQIAAVSALSRSAPAEPWRSGCVVTALFGAGGFRGVGRGGE